MSAKNDRNQSIKNALYELANIQLKNRSDATVVILKELERLPVEKRTELLPYVSERLIKGLSSSRLSARVGYATTLYELLKKFNEIPMSDTLNEIIKYLPMEKDNLIKDNAFGRVLGLQAVIRVTTDKQVSEQICTKIMEILMEVYEKYSHLQPLIVEAILIWCSKVDETVFSAQIWPHVKSLCQSSLDDLTVDKLNLIFELKKLHSKFIKKHSKISTLKDSTLLDDPANIKILTNIVLSVHETCPVVHPGVICFLEAIISNEEWLTKSWATLFENDILKHEHRTVVCYGFQVLSKLLPFLKSETQIKIVLSKNFFEILLKALVERNPTYRFSRHYAVEFVENLCKFIETSRFATETILNQIFEVSMNFDRLANVQLVRKLISNFKDTESTYRFFSTLIERVDFHNTKSFDGESALKFVYIIFSNHVKDEILTKKILTFLADFIFGTLSDEKSTKESPIRTVAAGVFFDCLCLLCDFAVKRRSVSIGFESDKVTIFEDLLTSYQEKLKEHDEPSYKVVKNTVKCLKKIRHSVSTEKDDTTKNGFALLLGYFGLWTIYKPKDYREILQEILTCHEECYANQQNVEDANDSWIDVLMDLFLSILSKPSRHFKIPVDVGFFYLSKRLKMKHLEPIFKVLLSDDAETMEMDDEFDPITENDAGEHSSTEESESEDEESEDSFNVDPKLRSDLENTLNLRKQKVDEDDKESVSSDLSDDAMFRLDAQLADVFRQHLKDKSVSIKALEEAERFRIQALDLILIFVRSVSDAELLVQTVVPLLNAVKKFSLTKTTSPLTVRLLNVIQIIFDKNNKISKAQDENQFLTSILDVLRRIFEISKSTSNTMVQRCCTNSLRFVFRLADSLSNEETKTTFVEQLSVLVDHNLNEFLTEPTCLSPVSIFETIFEKYWRHFWYLLPQLAEVVFNNDEIRLFRRTATSRLCHCFLRHYQSLTKQNMVDDKSITKPLKKFCIVFRKHLIPIFKHLSTMFGQKKKENIQTENGAKKEYKNNFVEINTKPNYLATLFKLLLPVLREMKCTKTIRDFLKVDETSIENDEFVETLRNLIVISNKWKNKDIRFYKYNKTIEHECKRSLKKIFRDILKMLGFEIDDKNNMVSSGKAAIADNGVCDEKAQKRPIVDNAEVNDESTNKSKTKKRK